MKRYRVGVLCETAAAVVLILSLGGFRAMHGSQSVTTQSFEVASIKPDTGSGQATIRTDPGRLTLENVDLKTIIGLAYGLRDDQVSGPSWLQSVRFDIQASTATPVAKELIPALLKPLLTERFKLATHAETRTLPVYALTVVQAGSRLHAVPAGGSPSFWTWPGGAHLNGMLSLAEFADALSRQTDRPVVDRTSLAGFYDIKLEWLPSEGESRSSATAKTSATPQPPANARAAVRPPDGVEIPTGPSLFTALQEQLGLRLSAEKGPVQILVVDHAERMPTTGYLFGK